VSGNRARPSDKRLDEYEDDETECAACGDGVDTPAELEEMLDDEQPSGCDIEDCDEPHFKNGFCFRHFKLDDVEHKES